MITERIKSYVLRQGRMTEAQKHALVELWPSHGLSLEVGMLDLDKVFNRQAPTYLEIGFGMGNSLYELAKSHPENNYIGVEVHRPGVGSLLLQAAELTNLKVFNTDVIDVLMQCIPNESLEGVLIFFPDPWPKKRHHKRRLIRPEYISLIKSKLKSKGMIHVATDWQDYAEVVMNLFSQDEGLENQAGLHQYAVRPDSRPLTKYEKRGQRLGHDVFDLVFTVKG